VGVKDGNELGEGLGIKDGLTLGINVVGNFVGLGDGIIDGDRLGVGVLGNDVGLGDGKNDGLPVGTGVGMAVGSHVVHVKLKYVVTPPVVNPRAYLFQP